MTLLNFKSQILLLVILVMYYSYGDYMFKEPARVRCMQGRQYEEASPNISHRVIHCTNSTAELEDNRICKCRTYRCRCCINFSFIRRWPAVGCFNIQSLPGNLNLIMSFSFNNRRLAYFPVLGSNPRPFCQRLRFHHVYTCLYVYDIHMYTKHDISLCLYIEVTHGLQPLVTIHIDCIRQFNHHLSLIPIRRPKRKGFIDVHIAKNDTAFTILKQVFHIPRRHRRKRRRLNKFWHVPKFAFKLFGIKGV